MSRSQLCFVIVTIALLGPSSPGCKSADNRENSQAEKPEAKKPVKPEAKKPAKPEAKKPAEPIAESAVKALMDKWLAAQNQGDFATYEGLYAQRLEGVRRSGKKVVRLNRKGWVKDRKGMFKRKMIVEMTDLDIDVFTQSAIATFTQRFAAGRYEDVGPKQIVIVRQDGDLRIAREEMLQSTLIGDVKKTAIADKRFVFVIEAGGSQYAVFDRFKEAPLSGLKLISKGDPVVVTAAVAADKLPAAVAEWRGATLQNGACEATVGDVVALSRTVPHFGERQTWDGTFDDSPPMSDDEIARAAFHEDGAYLVGELKTDGCSLGAYASVTNQPAPVAGVPVTEGIGALEKAARKAFRKLKDYRELADEFREYNPEDRWEAYLPEGSAAGEKPGDIQVSAMRHPSNNKVFVVAQAHAGFGCGDFEGSLTAFFEMSGSLESPRLKAVHETRAHPKIIAALDIAANGKLAFLLEGFTDTVLTSWKGKALRTLTVPFFDCGC